MRDIRPRLAEQVIRGELSDGEVVVSTHAGKQALIINAVGDEVLSLCDGSRTVGQIADFLRENLAVPPDVDVARDVEKLVDQLVRAGILVAGE